MNALDITILVILALFAVKGAMRGLLKEVCSLLGLGAGALVALRFYAPLAAQLSELAHLPMQLCVMVTMIVLFVLTMIIFSVAGAVMSRFVKLLFLGGLNRVLGALFSLLQGTLILALVLFGLSLTRMPETVRPLFKQSRLQPPFVQLGDALFKHSAKLFDQVS